MVGFGGRGGSRAPGGLGKSSRVAAVKLKAPASPHLPFPVPLLNEAVTLFSRTPEPGSSAS